MKTLLHYNGQINCQVFLEFSCQILYKKFHNYFAEQFFDCASFFSEIA